jgi:hypothetical protein
VPVLQDQLDEIRGLLTNHLVTVGTKFGRIENDISWLKKLSFVILGGIVAVIVGIVVSIILE